MGQDTDFKNAPKLFVGDLVTFSGYHYTPDYLLIDENPDITYGIVTEIKVNTPIGKIAYNDYILYRVFWFATGRYATEVGDHLKRVSP